MSSELLNILERAGELKRIPSAVYPSSVAGAFFLETARLVTASPAGDCLVDIFDWMTVKSLVGAVIGDWGPDSTAALGRETWREMASKALGHVLAAGPPQLRVYYEERFNDLWPRYHNYTCATDARADRWLKAICATPRAGYATVGRPKCIPYPRESQADHSLVSTVYASLLARLRRADVTKVCLMSLSHHLTAPLLPNVDHEVEQLIGPDESRRIEMKAAEYILSDFPAHVAEEIQQALATFRDGGCDEVERSIVLEADLLDRVLQVRYYEKIASLTVTTAIQQYELLNRGPLERFQREILRAYNLI